MITAVVVLRTLGFVIVRRLLGLVGLGPAPDATWPSARWPLHPAARSRPETSWPGCAADWTTPSSQSRTKGAVDHRCAGGDERLSMATMRTPRSRSTRRRSSPGSTVAGPEGAIGSGWPAAEERSRTLHPTRGLHTCHGNAVSRSRMEALRACRQPAVSLHLALMLALSEFGSQGV
jgi:hypothetical protein